MSTDYDIACKPCGVRAHLGQRMASTYSFGHGSTDEEGRRRVWGFIEEHSDCGALLVDVDDEFDAGIYRRVEGEPIGAAK